MQKIQFRAIRKDNNEFCFGYYWFDNSNKKHKITVDLSDDNFTCHEILIDTLGMFSGFSDKHGNDIYSGDDIYCLQPYRTTQTHTGDNIPNGSYTEPMEPGIRHRGGTVVFVDGCFQIQEERDISPMMFYQTDWDLESIKQSIEWRKQDSDWFEDPEEGDLVYLITEVAKVKDETELINYLNGWVIEGNIYVTPHTAASDIA